MAENLPVNERTEYGTHRERRSNSAVWVGLALLLFGGALLLRNLGVLDALGLGFLRGLRFDNWWALFMLIPGAMILKNVYDAYEARGRQLTRESRTQLIIGIVIVGFAVVFLFNLSMEMLWPVILIAVGALLLLNVSNR